MVKRSPAVEIADAVYAAAKDRELALRGLHAGLVRRLTTLLREVQDRDEVELVALTLLERDGRAFSASRSLGWGSYEFTRDDLRVPDGCWGWTLWVHKIREGTIKRSAEYWLASYGDALAFGNEGEAERALAMLERLRTDREASF